LANLRVDDFQNHDPICCLATDVQVAIAVDQVVGVVALIGESIELLTAELHWLLWIADIDDFDRVAAGQESDGAVLFVTTF